MAHIAFTIRRCAGNHSPDGHTPPDGYTVRDGYTPHDEHATHDERNEHDEHDERGYQSALPTWELLLEVRRLLGLGRRTERLVCRYLADLADRVLSRQDLALERYADELQAARCLFGLSARESRERVRIGRALRQLPAIERGWSGGELSYSRVREVTRVATAATEREWFELARQLDMRALERRVAAARSGPAREREQRSQRRGAEQGRFGAGVRSDGLGAKARRVSFELSEQACVLLERALANARRASGEECSDAEALVAVVRDALSVQANGNSSGTVVLDESVGETLARDEGTPACDEGCGERGRCDGNGARTVELRRERRNLVAEERAVREEPIRAWSWSDLGWDATHVGSRGEAEQERKESERKESERKESLERAQWGEVNTRVLRAMGRAGRWSADALIEASGLSAREVNVALTYLQLGGRVRRRADAFEPA